MEDVHVLRSRYSSREMQSVFSNRFKFTGWRRCWIALAEGERELGLVQVRPEYIEAMRRFREDIPYERAGTLERELRHDVMAHIRAYAEQVERVCSGAGGIIHLGATSAFPCDNTELMQVKGGLDLVIGKAVNVLRKMKPFVLEYLTVPCLARTHYQPAQPTTYGKRMADWMYNFTFALKRVEHERGELRARGVKGTTGTQDSFLEIFDGDEERVRALDRIVAQKLGFVSLDGEGLVYDVTTQTYPRIVDYHVLSSLAGLAIAAKKMGTDIRLLQGKKELSEPFLRSQVGSSAMAYKRNPMRAERACGLAREVISASDRAAHYAGEQWLERTLDDSAQRRIVLPDTFLGTDAFLNLALDIFTPDTDNQYGFRVYAHRARKNLVEEMPFIVTEKLIMRAVKAGGDRQQIHELVRQCSLKAMENINAGNENNMIELMVEHPELGVDLSEINELLEPKQYIGTVVSQTERFLSDVVDPVFERYKDVPEMFGGVKV